MYAMMRAALRLGAAVTVAALARAESHLMRFADIHEDRIVFTYEDDLWLVSAAGGPAQRITADPGTEAWAKFSPDGELIAFTGQYDGGWDVYVMEATGGVPRRLTYHPAMDRVIGWWPDGKSVLFRTRREYPFRGEQVYRVPVAGGVPEKLPIDRAGLLAVSPDGQMVVYNRLSGEGRTWKRHQGGDAQDLWLGSLDKQDYKKITDWKGADNYPMWEGKSSIFFISDRAHGTMNLYKYDVSTGRVEALTSYKDYDVKYPSAGPKAIVYQYGESLHVLDLTNGTTRRVPVEIPTDLVRMRSEFVSVSPSTGSFSLSPTGVRVLIEARGEILNYPAKDGEPVNLTRTSGSREKNAAWSPDGRWIAFLSDKTGEEEVYLVDQKGAGQWKQLTRGGLGFRLPLVWSPDSRWLLFSDKFMKLYLVDAASGEMKVVDQAECDDAWERWGIQDYVWSPDSRWIAYTKMGCNLHDSIFLYSLDEARSYRLTDGMTQDWSPSFDPEGRYLYFLSNRTFNPVMCFQDQNHVFLEMGKPYLFLLAADTPSPFLPKDSSEKVKEEPKGEGEKDEKAEEAKTDQPQADKDSEESAGEKKAAGKDMTKDGDKDKKKTRIDLDGIERRLLVAENVANGNYFRLEATAKGFLYLKKDEPEFEKYQVVTDRTGGKLDLYSYDLEKKEASKILSGIANYHLSSDGRKLVYRAGSTYGVVDAGAKASVGDGKIDLGRIRIELDRSAEFAQMFDEAWRIQRDWFYDPHMHGVDWSAMRERYRKFVPFCGNRADLNYLIGELIAELNVGHTYVSGGEIGSRGRSVPTGMLGAEFAVEPGAMYQKVTRIIPGTPGDPDGYSPLDEPGCPIKVGDYIIAIDGQEVTTDAEIYKHLQHKSGTIVTIMYNDKPSPDGAKAYRVRTIGDEGTIRYREWVERNRAYVDKQTGGQVGYVHIPDMGRAGLIEFAKVWYPNYQKKAFIIDDRYNGGGFTADMIIDRLERELWALTQPREGGVLRDPERCFWGPLAVLINEDTGSNGEFFAEAMKVKKLAPVIGMRTWGGAIGIEPHQDLVDGGTVTPPQFGLYGMDGKWLIEGTGVVPDQEVQNMPGDVLRGKDAQLDAGIESVMKALKSGKYEMPKMPAYPDKSK